MALYPCAPGGPNDYIYIMAVNRRMWQGIADTIGKPDLLNEPQFNTGKQRHVNAAALYSEIAEWTKNYNKKDCMERFAEAGVCASAVYQTNELFTDPHLLERGFIKNIDHREYGKVRLLGWPARMSKSVVDPQAAPLLGEHNNEVLSSDLGLSEATLRELREKGVIGCEESERSPQEVIG